MGESEINLSSQSWLREIIKSVKEEEFNLGEDECETLVSHLCENWEQSVPGTQICRSPCIGFK